MNSSGSKDSSVCALFSDIIYALTRTIELIRTHHAYCRLLQMLKPFYCLCLGRGLTTKSIMKLEPKIQVIYPSSYHSDFLPRMLMSSCSLCLESRSTIILMNVASADNYSASQGQSAWLPKLSKSSRILLLLMLSHQEFLFIICSEKACEKKRWGFRAATSSGIPASAPGSAERRVETCPASQAVEPCFRG